MVICVGDRVVHVGKLRVRIGKLRIILLRLIGRIGVPERIIREIRCVLRGLTKKFATSLMH